VGTQNLPYDHLNYLDGEELLKPLAVSIYESENVFMSENLTMFHAISLSGPMDKDRERGDPG
jgi:hypothetical protein